MSPASKHEMSATLNGLNDIKTSTTANPTTPLPHSELYRLPISARPDQFRYRPALLFATLYNFGCLSIVATQFLVWPLRFFGPTRGAYDRAIDWTKGAFALLCMCVIQWFAPVKLVITADEGVDLEEICVRNTEGEVVYLKLPQKFVCIANHQCYLDWMYLWCMLVFARAHQHIYIILMDRFKWIPILGWGMQFYRFMFIKRSWTADRAYLGKKLLELGRWAMRVGDPFVLMIYPEGTLVSDETRAISRRYSEKTGIPEMTNMLIPRSTGLLFALRTLAPSIPNLALVDITIGYAGIPPAGYGQDFYTLRSVFFNGVSPPTLHLHLRMWQAKNLPLGELSSSPTRGAEATQEEKDIFDKWLLDRWREKDRWMDDFYKTGEFSAKQGRFERPLEVRGWADVGQAFCWGVPVVAGWVMYRTFA